jgi:hypothetical protein
MNCNLFLKNQILGETIEVHCTVENMCSAGVIPRASLYQTQIFMSGERHKTVENSLTDAVIGTVVEAGATASETIFVSTPRDISLSIKSSIITIKYFIHVTLDIPHSIDLHINLPVVITNECALDHASKIS